MKKKIAFAAFAVFFAAALKFSAFAEEFHPKNDACPQYRGRPAKAVFMTSKCKSYEAAERIIMQDAQKNGLKDSENVYQNEVESTCDFFSQRKKIRTNDLFYVDTVINQNDFYNLHGRDVLFRRVYIYVLKDGCYGWIYDGVIYGVDWEEMKKAFPGLEPLPD